MLRRDWQLRTQIYVVKDAALFAVGLWLAHFLRSVWKIDLLPGFHPVEGFDKFIWLYLIVLPGRPLAVALQGFYQRPLLCSRRVTAWMLLKGCALTVLGVISLMFLLKISLARSVIVLFGITSFVLVFISEELLL